MSQPRDDLGTAEKALGTVTPGSKGHRDVSMDTIGYRTARGILIVLLPLLPILIVGWLSVRILGFVRRNVLGN